MICALLRNTFINNELFQLDFNWPGTAPKAGQFFMIKPLRSSVFLARPISVADWQPAENDNSTVGFLIARRGSGTMELSLLQRGEEAELIGPLGNAWSDFLPEKSGSKPIALIGGGAGIAPLNALLSESSDHNFVMLSGFKTSLIEPEEKSILLKPAVFETEKTIIVTEDGKAGKKGLVTDFFEPEQFSAVCACGPEAMLRVVAKKCSSAGVPCYVCLERHMACGVGACLGCTVNTVNGNRRCCADGPIFHAQEVFF